ncbi:MAG: hypothetical protein C4560_02945 [Nitrospiraceae bacterium]|nr:MAG: hypothetical protein C4560_02945 [Nitrospiraceae bacterium]
MRLKKNQVLLKIAFISAKMEIDLQKINKLKLKSLIDIMMNADFKSDNVANKLVTKFLQKEAA